MNIGYPAEAADRKKRDMTKLEEIKGLAQTNMVHIFQNLDDAFINPIFKKRDLMNFILKNGKNTELIKFLKCYKCS